MGKKRTGMRMTAITVAILILIASRALFRTFCNLSDATVSVDKVIVRSDSWIGEDKTSIGSNIPVFNLDSGTFRRACALRFSLRSRPPSFSTVLRFPGYKC